MRASKMLPVNGHHTWVTGHRLLDHTAVNMRRSPGRPTFKGCVAEGNSHTASESDNEVAQIVNRFRRSQKWQQSPRQGNQLEQKGFAASQPELVPKSSAGQQKSEHDQLRDPRQITAFISQQKQTAVGLTTGSHPEAGLTTFCANMDGLLSRSGLAFNHIHFSAIITAATQIWAEAHRSPTFSGHADVKERLKTLFQRCLQSLQALHADMGAQAISNVLWSSAALSFNPDNIVPGTVHALKSRFRQVIDVADEKQHPNAQECANVLWALARLGRSTAAAKEMVDSVCLHFALLTQHSTVKQRPTAQGCSTLLRALATMKQQSASATEAVDIVCLHCSRLVESPSAQQRPTIQAVANLVWALGTLKHTPSDDGLLSHCCGYVHTLLRNQDAHFHPTSQAIGNMLWALAKLKYAPPHDVATAMFDHLLFLSQTPSLQPNSQAISNCFLACAEFRLDMKATCVIALLKHFMGVQVSDVRYHVYCNLAWSLAVMQCLDLNTFEALLDKLTFKHKFIVQASSHSSFAQLNTAGIRQLYQALAWLSPPSGSKQMAAWFKLRSRLQTLAPEPRVGKLSPRGQTVLWAALAKQGVPYAGDKVLYGMYQAHAVLSPGDSSDADVILMLEHPEDYMKNLPSRVLGHVAFRNRLLARYGTVVAIPYNPGTSNVESMAVDIKAAVEAQAGLSLNSFS